MMKMKATSLLKNAIILKTEGQRGLSNKLIDLLRDIELKGLSSIAAYVAAQLDNNKDPVVNLMREARTAEAPSETLLENATQHLSTFNAVLNKRYGGQGTLIMDATDPSLPRVVAALPNGLLRSFQFESTPLKKIEGVLSGQFALSSYLQSLTKHIKDQHVIKKAKAELHAEVSQGEGYNSFSRMAFLRHEAKHDFAHACLFRNGEGQRFATLQFAPAANPDYANTWYPQEIAKTFLFSHELGHCVTPDSVLNASLATYFEDADATAEMFRRELFGDLYASCFMAKITGNWDFLYLCILPVRAAEGPDHNTFHLLRKLPQLFSDPRAFTSLSDEDLVRTAESLYERLNPVGLEKVDQCFHDAAAMMLRKVQNSEIRTEDDFAFHVEACSDQFSIINDEYAQERIVGLLMTRLQSDIDLIGMLAQFGVTSEWIREHLKRIALAVEACGNKTVATNLSNLSQRPAETLRQDILGYVSKGGLNTLARYEEMSMSIADFWEQWGREEKRLGRHDEPAPAGRALG